MVSKIYTAALSGLDGFIVDVECNQTKGVPEIDIIGLPDTTVKESLDRIRSAAQTNSLPFICGRTILNLAPADKKKEGSSYDLPILLAVLKHSVLENADTDGMCFIGELSLSGELRPVRGALSMTICAKKAGLHEIYLPYDNRLEASVVDGIKVYGVKNISELLAHLRLEKSLDSSEYDKSNLHEGILPEIDFSQIKGQERAKRALEIAAAGSHNVIMIGPPGSGKSMLSKALPGILPDMTFDEMLESTQIHSICGLLTADKALIKSRPFRSPHHTISWAGLAGGGTNPLPGEISLSHNGVLFLDEIPEFPKHVLEILRQPLEDGKMVVTRVKGKVVYPSKFMLVCAMNPCPCGYYGSDRKMCTCSESAVKRYVNKISGPLLDRIDIQIEVPAISYDEMTETDLFAESSATVKERVNRARRFASERHKSDTKGESAEQISATLDAEAEMLLKDSFDKLTLSARGYTRILKVARTIADLELSEKILAHHLLEAVQLRSLDRKYFNFL